MSLELSISGSLANGLQTHDCTVDGPSSLSQLNKKHTWTTFRLFDFLARGLLLLLYKRRCTLQKFSKELSLTRKLFGQTYTGLYSQSFQQLTLVKIKLTGIVVKKTLFFRWKKIFGNSYKGGFTFCVLAKPLMKCI